MDVPVVPFLRVVANGVATLKDREPQRLRATLIATPEKLEGGDIANAIELAKWPGAFAERIAAGQAPAVGKHTFTLRLREFRAAASKVEFCEYSREAEAVGHRNTTGKEWDSATRAWRAAMQKHTTEPWAALADEIKRSLTGQKREARPRAEYALPKDLPADFDADGAILANGPAPGQLAAINGIVPVRQGMFAIDEESVRAARVLTKMAAGPHTIEDEPCLCPEGEGRKVPQNFSEKRKEKHYQEFQDAVRATNSERAESAATFDAVQKLVKGEAATASKPCGMRGDRAVLPRAERVRDGKADGAERSTHDYGTWLQRRPDLKTTWDTEKNRIVPPSFESASAPQAADQAAAGHVNGVFYAFQGDPILSRLFCLAVDLEFELPEDLKGRKKPIYLQLSVEHTDEAGRCTPVVATAAKLSCEGFWPVSVFEAGLSGCPGSETLISDPCSVEQSDGFWHLDAGYAPDDPKNHTPRYDLSSLDIRRSVDAKPDGTDRGQRHLTAGFTVLDHGRGAQVACDLALAAANAPCVEEAAKGCATRPTAVLYAEELTIGRRVDVAGATAGAAFETLEWRSLMQRLVRFEGFEPALQQLLGHLLRGQERERFFLDEASFQVAARLMPVVGADSAGTTRSLEAVAEEAIFLWDGTPASVLTEPGPVPKEQEEDLPFKRRLEAPDRGNAASALRPVPLRFGASYVFRLRSMFLGGGSPAADTQLTEDQGGVLLPPAIGKQAIPRRFLRHESVPPPILLLPVHLATQPVDDKGVMGFELADQAIVRSGVEADDKPTDAIREPGASYVPLAKRCFPTETMRVFVVPQAAPDMLRRHGKLPDDRAGREVVLRGGLLDVAFDPIETSQKPVRRATNFPTVITRSVQGFGNEGVVQARTLSRGKGDEIGIPVFEPGGRNTTELGEIGYLPDPAVDMMAVRLRVRRSGRYLEGHLAVDVYDSKAGIAYPNALPLVVTVKRSTKDRSQPAVALKTVLAQEGAPLRWMDPSGSLAKGRLHGRATRVRHVALDLCRGEDFDLEIACLPNERTFGLTFSLPETIAIQLADAAVDERNGARLAKLAGPPDAAPFTVQPPTQASCCFTGLAGRRVPPGGAVKRSAEEILAVIKDKWPIEEVAAVTTVRVCHAVNAPSALADAILTDLKARRPELPDNDKEPTWEENPDLPDAAGAKTLLLTGTLELDLERVDGFEIVAATARALDDKTRSRSLIARRSGRWPKLTIANGDRRYIAPRYVVGFDVDAQARASFLPEQVTLLRVHNLPARAEDGIGAGLFGKREGRLTSVSLGRLFASAIAGRPIAIPVDGDAAPPSGTCGKERRHVVTASRQHIIEDTRARKLSLRVTALSRSAEAFETAPRYGGNGAPTLHRRQPLKPYDQSRTSACFEVWVPSTLRPPVCEILRPEVTPVITREANATKTGVVQVLRRDLMTRFWLKRGWGASGEGERLGIVLWPPSYFSQAEADIDGDVIKLGDRRPSIASFEDADLGPGGAFVTRWGGDPIRRDAQPQNGFLISPKAFADALEGCTSPHKPKIVDRVLMPLRRTDSDKPKGKDDFAADPAPATDMSGAKDAPRTVDTSGTKEEPGGFIEVTLLTFEPCFDLDREEWFVDVDLKPIRAAEPFVRFGLVRYQENAICDTLKVSFPVSAQAQLMPSRELLVEPCTCPEGNKAVSVTLRGNGSLGIKPLKIEESFRGDPNLSNYLTSFAKLQKPNVRVTVFHEVIESTELLLRTPISQTETWVTAENSLDVASLVWTAKVSLPDNRMKELGTGKLVVYVEEVDLQMPSSYSVEPIVPEALFDEKTFRETGPRFSARVPFLDVS